MAKTHWSWKKDHGGGAKGGMVKDHTFPPNSVPFPSVFVNKVRGGGGGGRVNP